MAIQFFRVELNSHYVPELGPYNAYRNFEDDSDEFGGDYDKYLELSESISTDHNDQTNYPTPFDDEKLGDIAEDEYCGFRTIDELKMWFGRIWLTKLHEYDFVIRCYKMRRDDVRIGATQSVAVLDNAISYETIEIPKVL